MRDFIGFLRLFYWFICFTVVLPIVFEAGKNHDQLMNAIKETMNPKKVIMKPIDPEFDVFGFQKMEVQSAR